MIRIQSSNPNFPLKQTISSFKEDIVDLFLGLKTAHLASHTFEHGAHLWEEFFNTPSDYYVVKDEINLIRDNALVVRKICTGVTNIIDLGPGSSGAVNNKTFPILKNLYFSVENYYGVDVSLSYLKGAQELINKEFPALKTTMVHKNFFDPLGLPINDRSLALLFGITLSNMPGIYDKASGIGYLLQEMKSFRALLPKGAFFLCSYDTCQDQEKMMKAYDHPKHGLFIKNITSKIKSDLSPQSGFDQDAWFYNPKWDAKNHMFKHILTSKKPMGFSIDNHSFEVPENFDILSYMSVKFPEQIYLDIFKQAGFELATEPFKSLDEDINISLLRAV